MKPSPGKGRRKTRKTDKVVSSGYGASVSPFVAVIETLTLERDKLRSGLQDALHFYDRMSANGKASGGGAWSTSDIKRIAEIRALVKLNAINADIPEFFNGKPPAPQLPPAKKWTESPQ